MVHTCAGLYCRIASTLGMSPQHQRVLEFLCNQSSQDLGHVHPDTDMARMFDRSNTQLSADALAQRHFMINLLAVVLQLPPDSSVLSTHMFAPGDLYHTHPLGSTRNTRVGHVHYDCGVRLSEDFEMIDAQPPLQDPASVYFVTLISWSSMVLGHMLFEENHAAMYGPVLSLREVDERIPGATDHAWLSKFMFVRIESCWMGLQYKAGISADPRLLVLVAAMQKLHTGPVTQADKRVFATNDECKTYEAALRDAFFEVFNARYVILCVESDGNVLSNHTSVMLHGSKIRKHSQPCFGRVAHHQGMLCIAGRICRRPMPNFSMLVICTSNCKVGPSSCRGQIMCAHRQWLRPVSQPYWTS